MAPIPQPTARTVRAIYHAYEAANEHFDSLGISVGEIGGECDRALYYALRWASRPEEIIGRKLSIFRTGDRWEEVLVSDLERIGVEVYDQQDRIRLLDGHVRGKIDGKAIGIPEAPKTEHLCEFKSSNDKSFKEIVKLGCKVAKPLHYGQCQIGMHYFGLSRCLYLVVNKNDDERYAERIEYDAEYCMRQLARCERIITADEPPVRICENTNMPPCLFCKHKAVCHEDAFPRVSCRTCLHSTPEMGGDGHWSCARWSKPLSVDEQKAACPAHLHLPSMVPGALIETNEEAETITYQLNNGKIWIDGGQRDEAA
ncbi:oxidoreductase [Mesorhizobium sp. M00.F.Ca.ET.217.01.1.1]|uniref:oxidoreductase n=1 Tax=Mesorhizobium sp. M00.F.Ca.ET.217.01.1.1 TaxID=2500529 RepID=UPI000FD858E8|nr:oxidoreductase [Mesorhizobium sp. M00.F.Ca.ET.217.01.1.1]TGQ19281.1 oxidoreductase [Mesorhizobium sp. M00.F.Ca.ET.217.01.1.1]